MPLLPRMNIMLDFVCMAQVELPGARTSENEKKNMYKVGVFLWSVVENYT